MTMDALQVESFNASHRKTGQLGLLAAYAPGKLEEFIFGHLA